MRDFFSWGYFIGDHLEISIDYISSNEWQKDLLYDFMDFIYIPCYVNYLYARYDQLLFEFDCTDCLDYFEMFWKILQGGAISEEV